jgi:hypothetical protein
VIALLMLVADGEGGEGMRRREPEERYRELQHGIDKFSAIGGGVGLDRGHLGTVNLVTTTEAEQGKRLSEPLIKQITGNDALTARFLYGEFFDFIPIFKVFMATNHKPLIRGTDYGIWRRIKLIPFTTTITPERQDKHLEEKLMSNEDRASGEV